MSVSYTHLPFYFWIFFSIVAIKLFGFFIATLIGMSTVGLPAKRSIPLTAISCACLLYTSYMMLILVTAAQVEAIVAIVTTGFPN